MSKLIQRIGTNQQVFSYDITVHYIRLSLMIPVRINIVWKRRQKRIETKNHPALSPSLGSVDINETLTMINTLYQDKSGKFQRKKAVLSVQALVEGKGSKKVGQLALDLSEHFSLDHQELPLSSCPDRKAAICISIRASILSGGLNGESQSEFSEDFSMGTEGNLSEQLFEQDLGGFEEPCKRQNSLTDTAEVEKLKYELEMLKNDKKLLKTELVTLAERHKLGNGSLVKHIQDLDNENCKLRDQLEKIENRNRKSEDLVKKLSMKNASLQHDLRATEKPSIDEVDREIVEKELQEQYRNQILNLEETIDNLKSTIREYSFEIQELKTTLDQALNENKNLKNQLMTVSMTEFSDPANVIMQEELRDLKEKLLGIENTHLKEKESLVLRLRELEVELKNTEKERRESGSQVCCLKEQLQHRRKPSNYEIQAIAHEEELQSQLQILKIENEDIKRSLSLIKDDCKAFEKKYVDAKTQLVNTEIQNEQFHARMLEAQEKLRYYSSEYTTMEVEMYRINERMAQLLNCNNDLELELHILRKSMKVGEKCK